MKPVPEQGRLVSPVEGGAPQPASDARLVDPKLELTAPPRQAGGRARTGLVWLRLLIGVAILGLILGRIDLGAATVRPTSQLLVAVLAGASLLVLSQAVAAVRWKAVLGNDLLPWGYLWRLYTIGSFFGLFLPTSVGGDAVRALAAARSSGRTGRAMASVLIDRGFGVAASLAYAALGLILAPRSIALLDGAALSWRGPGLVGTGLLLMAAGLGVLVVRGSSRVRAVWRQGTAAVVELARAPRRLARVATLALISQGLVILLWYLLARGVHFTLPTSTFLWAVPLVGLCALLPVTFAGLGVREGVWLVLLSDSGIPPADVVAFSLLYFACTLLVGISGGFLFVTSGMTLASADGARV